VIGDTFHTNEGGRVYLYQAPFDDSVSLTFNWGTRNTSFGKHTSRVEIAPVTGETDRVGNTRNLQVEVKASSK